MSALPSQVSAPQHHGLGIHRGGDPIGDLVLELRAATAEVDDARKKSAHPSAPEARLSGLLEKYHRQSVEQRTEVTARIGQDELALRVLSILVQNESDWRLRVHIVDALAGFGMRALDVLAFLADDPVEEVGVRVVETLGRVTLAAHPELHVKGEVGWYRGAPRMRGISARHPVSADVERVLALLDRLRRREWSEKIREAADRVLGALDV